MTLRPDDDLPPDPEDVTTADAADRTDEDPELQANRTDVEGSPTGHS